MQSSFFRSTSLSLVCPETIPISQNAYINSKKKSWKEFCRGAERLFAGNKLKY